LAVVSRISMDWVFQRASGGQCNRSVESCCVQLPSDVNLVPVVRLSLDHRIDNAFDILDEAERARATRFVFERDRRHFVAAHAWTRLVLARCLGCTPQALRIAASPQGKPYLVNASAEMCFNLSHAGERALLAIGHDRPVGVDIEQHRSLDPMELARRFFARDEIDALEKLDAESRIEAFFRCWTRKEALIKAIGDGLLFPLDGFAVRVDDDRSTQLLRTCSVAPEVVARWRIVPLETERGYEAALAATAGEWRVVEWRIAAA
jgi:4'-phosphopantetheinyl transferase